MTVLTAIVGLLILWDRISSPIDADSLHDYRQTFLDGVWGDENHRLFIDSSHNKIVYKGDVSFCAVVCGLGFDEEMEGAPKPGDEICLEGVYNIRGDGFAGYKGDFYIEVLWQVDDDLARYVVNKRALDWANLDLPKIECWPTGPCVSRMRRVPIEEWSRDGSTPDATKSRTEY